MTKYLFVLILLGALCFNLDAQNRISLTKTAGQVETLSVENQAQNERIALLEATNQQLLAKLDTLANPQKISVPTTIEEAKGLLVYILSFVQFVLVGIWGNKLPRWLSPFVLSIIVGAVISVVAYFGSGGAFSIGEAVTFFLAVAGGSNIIHQIKKPLKDEKSV
jgi:hypothetical protein